MNPITTISTKGQVTIPDYIRTQLNIKPGDKAHFIVHNQNQGELYLKVVKPTPLSELAGSLHIPGMKYIPIDKAREIAAAKSAKTDWKKRGLIP